jgi:Mrp family chromosome partitioning ATPase/capsular polysaccharide biosynthesis protein
MTLEQYWTILKKQWKLVVICFLFVGAGAFVGSKLMKPLYQSSTLVQVVIRNGNNQANYDNLLASEQLVQTEATLATSDPVLREVASHYPHLSVIQLAGEVSSSPKTNTQLFEIDVVDPSPTRAASLANDIAATLIKQQLQAAQKDNAQAQQQIQQNIDVTSQQIDDTTAKISALQAKGGNQGQLARLQAQLSGLQQRYSQWQTALAQLGLTQAQGGNPLWVAQPAQPAINRVRPNTLLNTGGGLAVGLLLGVLLAILFELLDTRVRTPEALTELLDWPVLATIWQARSSKKADVFNPTGHDGNVEGYRILRTNIGFSSIDKPLHSLMITSAMPRDGKSIIAANLAIFMAKVGKATLLIDADLRRPGVHDLFGLPADRVGLSNAVLAFGMPKIPETPPLALGMTEMSGTPGNPNIPNAKADHRLHPATLQPADALAATSLSLEPFVHSVGIPNLWVMPSGPLPPNPPELLDSKAMQRLLAAIANYGVEVVIFDTPLVLGLSDVSILASKMDGTLVVVDMMRANKRNLKQMKALLMQAGAHVVGCVMNKQRRGRHDTAYSFYYGTGEQNGKKNHNAGKENAPARHSN